MAKLHIQGWRFINHSYALVNQHQILAMLRCSDVDISFEELPLFDPSWQQSKTGFDAASLQQLDELSNDSANADAVLRYWFPYDFTPADNTPTFVFGTSEFSALSTDQIKSEQNITDALAGNDTQILTPSAWSKQGFINSGVEDSRIHIVPHGVDTKIFHPDPSIDRQGMREKLGAGDDSFLFLNIGAMTTNKGIEQLLAAFARHRQSNPRALLILKGQDNLYGSGGILNKRLMAVAEAQGVKPDDILEGLRYIGDDFAPEKMADLYRVTDAYVSPYLAEGFNLPVLEAVASGLPVICTAGGPTEDFCTDQFSLKIDSALANYSQGRQFLLPDIDHLISLMEQVQSDEAFRGQAAKNGPAWAQEKFTWDAVARRLISVIL
ncbi:MAG: glycosyltransferase family 4 protein [Rhodospirillaceae bacterium]|nr:glycosyltransferase family 4 protein [Rhodospirillaceae bacterium]